MDGRGEEYNEEQFGFTLKRKVRTRKLEFVGWGSKPLIEFLQSIGEETTKQISQYDVADIVNKYVNDNSLLHPSKKKRIVCDEKLHSVFGKKTISRIKIYEMLGAHYAENQDESDFGFLFGADEENGVTPQKSLSLEKKKPLKETVLEKPKSCFAAIVPQNIKLVYLKKSLAQDLLKRFENFEAKVVGSFVRIKSDPYDYLQKNSHMLVQVTGLKKASGTDGMKTDILLQVSNCVKDIGVSLLSDDDFKLEECVDLQQRVKSGLLKRPTVVELQEKAQILHEDITKHWLPREIAMLQRLIDRANEKGWRKELLEYLEKKQMLQTPEEQARLFHEVPIVIADELEPEAVPQDLPNEKDGDDGSPISTITGISQIPSGNAAENRVFLAAVPPLTDSFGSGHDAVQQLKQPRDTNIEKNKVQLINFQQNRNVVLENQKVPHDAVQQLKQPKGVNMEKNKVQLINFQQNGTVVLEKQKVPEPESILHRQFIESSQLLNVQEKKMIVENQKVSEPESILDRQVIELSDDDEEHRDPGEVQIHFGNPSGVQIQVQNDMEDLIWCYVDPQGDIQGPFSLPALKRWKDADFFPDDFKVWKKGQSPVDAVLLTDLLRQMFPL